MPQKCSNAALSPLIAVEICDLQGHLRIDSTAVVATVCRVLKAEGVTRASISVAFVDDAAIHEINRLHLGHDWPTDVITFSLIEDDGALSGEIVISAQTAATTAWELGRDPNCELELYVVHGVLHLCGYDDQTQESAAQMRRLEARSLEVGSGVERGWLVDSPVRGATALEGGGSTCKA